MKGSFKIAKEFTHDLSRHGDLPISQGNAASILPPGLAMELVLPFLLAEAVVMSTAVTRARGMILEKWREGSLSETELRRLKQAPWFRRQFLQRCSKVTREKKTN